MSLDTFKHSFLKILAQKRRTIGVLSLPALLILGGFLLNKAFAVTPIATQTVLGGPDEYRTIAYQTPEAAVLASSNNAGSFDDTDILIEPDQGGNLSADAASLEFAGLSTGDVAKQSNQSPADIAKGPASGPGGLSRATYLPLNADGTKCVWGVQGRFNGGAHGPDNAQDIDAPVGTPVVASCDGVVVRVDDTDDYNGGWGNRVVIKIDGGDYYIVDAHLRSDIQVVEGEHVIKGEPIAHVGMTGHTNGAHLHIAVQKALR